MLAGGFVFAPLTHQDRALRRASESAEEVRRVKKELALSDNELRKQRDEALKELAEERRHVRLLRDANDGLRDEVRRLGG